MLGNATIVCEWQTDSSCDLTAALTYASMGRRVIAILGLDQTNINFPLCTAANATVEQRYDAFLDFASLDSGTNVRMYLPMS
jgi:hypothetical protein